MRKTPCKDCPRRVLGCQAKCNDYKSFIEDLHARKKYCAPKPADLYAAEGKRKKKKK